MAVTWETMSIEQSPGVENDGKLLGVHCVGMQNAGSHVGVPGIACLASVP